MFGQALARGFAHAVHHIQHAGGQAGFERNLGKQMCGERAPLSRFVDHAASGRKGWRYLPRTEHERRVPWRDNAHRADRLAGGVVDMVGRGERLAVVGTGRLVSEESEVRSAT